jgi:hypothetical protein
MIFLLSLSVGGVLKVKCGALNPDSENDNLFGSSYG